MCEEDTSVCEEGEESDEFPKLLGGPSEDAELGSGNDWGDDKLDELGDCELSDEDSEVWDKTDSIDTKEFEECPWLDKSLDNELSECGEEYEDSLDTSECPAEERLDTSLCPCDE